MPAFLESLLSIYPEKPAMAFWRACELQAINSVLSTYSLPLSPSLDLACGDGKVASLLFGKAVIDVGVDNSPGEVALARDQKAYREVLKMNVSAMTLPKNHFRFVFSNSSFEHFSEPAQVFFEINRLIVPNGFLLITVPTDHFINNQLFSRLLRSFGLSGLAKKYGWLRNARLGHQASNSGDQWAKFVEDAGFSIIYRKGYFSPLSTSWWDLISYHDFVIRLVPHRFLSKFVPASLKNLWRRFWFILLRPFYERERESGSDDGSCLLLLGRRGIDG